MYGLGDVVQLLIDSGANPNAADCGSKGITSLCLAVQHPQGAECVRILLRAGVDPNVRPDGSDDGRAPLHRCWNRRSLQLLLDAGAKADVRNADGWPPLITYTDRDEAEYVAILLRMRADPDTLEANGNSALGYAEYREHFLPRCKRTAGTIAKLLRGAKASEPGCAAARAVVAASKGDVASVLRWTRQAKSVDCVGPYGLTPLAAAVGASRLLVVQRLLELGADPDVRDGSGRTPLMIAAAVKNASESLRMAEALVQANADINLESAAPETVGLTALAIARLSRNRRLADYLQGRHPARSHATPGIEDFGGRRHLLLVEAGHDDVARALATLVRGTVSARTTVRTTDPTYEVLSFAGIGWVVANPIAASTTEDLSGLARRMAATVGGRAIVYCMSDAPKYGVYTIYDPAGRESRPIAWVRDMDKASVSELRTALAKAKALQQKGFVKSIAGLGALVPSLTPYFLPLGKVAEIGHRLANKGVEKLSVVVKTPRPR
jgi:ankyrin repeat protein